MRIGNVAVLLVTRLRATIAAIMANVMLGFLGCRSVREASELTSTRPTDKGDITITIVYDNNPGVEGLTPAWSFACVVQLPEKTILFDTGGDGRILLGNMQRLNVDPKQMDVIVLSHIHGDHTEGLPSVLRTRPGVAVYIPTGFPAAFKEQIQSLGGQVVEAEESESVCPAYEPRTPWAKAPLRNKACVCSAARDGF